MDGKSASEIAKTASNTRNEMWNKILYQSIK